MKKPITEETRVAILEAAWDLMATQQRLGAGMAELAATAGVSRQTLFYAFGNRAGLLVAMVRHRDEQSDHVSRLASIARGDGHDVNTLLAFIDVWVEYLPLVYPVAIQLELASLTDTDAAAAWDDRFGKGLKRGLDLVIGRMAAARKLPRGVDPSRVADACFSLLLPSAWRVLVMQSGWTPKAFCASRHAMVRAALAAPGQRAS